MEKFTFGFWIMLATLALASVILTEGAKLLKDAPLQLIKSGPAYPKSFRSEGFIISSVDADWQGPVASECACRVICWTHVSFAGYSTHKEGETILCRVASLPPYEITFEENPSGTYTYWKDSVKSILYRYYGKILYLVPEGNKNFDDGKAFCERIPGHRLGIFQEEAALRDLGKIQEKTGLEIWIDLHNTPNGPTWGDGVPLDFNTTLPIFDVWYTIENTQPLRIRPPGILDDNPRANVRGFVCQANSSTHY